MKKLGFVLAVVLIFLGVALKAETPAPDKATSADWKDITDRISIRKADQVGFTEDAKAKIYGNADGNQLKLTTAASGEFLIDLAALKVYSLKPDGSKSELPDMKLKQRNGGMMLVLMGKELKMQCVMKEKVSGMAKVPGLTAM
jgi:hypothetical protein